MKYLAAILLVCTCTTLYSQKPSLTTGAFKEWPEILRYNISDNGKHAWFITIDEQNAWILHLTSSDTLYKKDIQTGLDPVFTRDSRYFLYKVPVDTLFIEDLDKHITTFITGVSEFSVPENGGESWIAYKTYKDRALVVKNIRSGILRIYKNVITCLFNPQGTEVVIQTADALRWLSLVSLKEKLVVRDSSIRNMRFSFQGDRIAFVSAGQQLNYYEEGTDSVKVFRTEGISESPLRFSEDGKTIFYSRRFTKPVVKKDSLVITSRLNIWHYKDEYLQDYQLNNLEYSQERDCLTALSIGSGNVISLEDPDTTLILSSNHYALLRRNINTMEARLKGEPLPGLVLVSLTSGLRREIRPPGNMLEDTSISPDECFITWFDSGIKHYFSYEISTGVLRNISRDIPYPVFDKENDRLQGQGPYGIVGWIGKDSLLIYDRFDIWLVDPSNKQVPVNITNGYGRKNNIVFRNAAATFTDTLLLAGFNIKNKRNGFFWLQMNKDPVPVVFGPYLYYFPPLDIILSNDRPVRAKHSNAFLTKRMTATAFPNLFLVNEKRQQIPLTTFEPQQHYNWLTAELIHWKMPDGKLTSGILYKPENFDPSKKYPVIFNYYEKKSNGLYIYPKPGVNTGTLDIARYVSNGYLVLLPDIHFKPGLTGESALQTIEAAAKHLSVYPWVDKHKMGLQGHSFGGYETNYIITHSNLFAAAQEGAGSSNLVSAYGYLTPSGGARHELYEIGQSNLRTRPWIDPDVYIKNSPVFNVHKVTTPLLMMHNKEDSAVPFAQAIEFFTALRRENKKVWLLQYDKGSHTLDSDPEIALDFNIRQQQFFGHYLKDAPPPLWMTEGVPAIYKGMKSGLEIDSSGKRP
ncbi:alpha/beta hydrolase family protein [Chitinophaga tropicalis]|uniref:Prolyl oligopeptidase family serine peptidase n=1 Tax=Chitinophaga tropicalis TaxID=2683588 RepID=A0A7K1U5N7_9BACT|nr:prolyl oligopeptidase family serine peptidase [Chitinophaga tropicalis]MVT09682.1 prolyl oligopeptidase family serine peptidase [Chitinophaga tropicalis]